MVFAPSVLPRRLFLGLLIASIACSERDADPTSPGESLKAAAGSRALNSAATLDGERDFVEVSNEVPSFGGYFLSDEGQLVVYVADTADFGKARNAMSQRAAAGKFAHGARFQRPAVVVRKGTYSYRDLARWRDVVTQTVLGRVNGAISSDMDERRNTVTIGLLAGSEAAARSEIQKVLAANGIPVAAVHYVSQPPIRKTSWPVTMLASSADTLIGGMRFHWRATPTTVGGCTIGFPAAYNTGAVGFVTAAHCSHDQWETNDSSHARTSLSGQASAEPAIGVEYYDPLAGTCPFFWPCDRYRYSDASLYRVTGRPVRVGWLARPTTRRSSGSADTTVNSSIPYLFVTGTTSSITDGSTIDHIGATTGWRYGTVNATCVDYFFEWSIYNDLVRCAYKSSMDVDGGDSGGPVFYFDQINGTVIAAGIIHGNWDGDMLFSKWSYVESELSNGGPVSSINILVSIVWSGSLNLTGDVDDLAQQPILNWDPVTTNLPGSTTVYNIYRKVWSASSQSFISETGLGGTTSTTYTDTSVPFSIATYMGTTQPQNYDNYVVYTITPYNTGKTGTPSTVYFRQDP